MSISLMKIMWTLLWVQLTVQLAWCQETLGAGNCSSHAPCDDKTAMLQFQVQQSADQCTTQEEEDLNAGTCGADGACRCTPDPDPQIIGPFNLGGLRCAGRNSCRSDSNAAADKDKFFQFADSSNYLDCSGEESCRVFWNVKNVGAACCSDQNACHNKARIHMDTSGVSQCTNDMCCSGINACKQSEVKGVDNLLCADNGACDQIDAEISGDFYCQAKQGCGDQTGGGDKGGFAFSAGDDHCVTCDSLGGAGSDQGSCQKAAMTFGANSEVKMTCSGFKACFQAELTLDAGTCLSLSCSGDNACAGMTVDLNGGECSCTGVNCPTTGPPSNTPICTATCTDADALSCRDFLLCWNVRRKPRSHEHRLFSVLPHCHHSAADHGTADHGAAHHGPAHHGTPLLQLPMILLQLLTLRLLRQRRPTPRQRLRRNRTTIGTNAANVATVVLIGGSTSTLRMTPRRYRLDCSTAAAKCLS
ncbi:unnamed protein product [Durusdinium trenchii]|uniref:Uncharacterized protein n=1 Tax=Durusdinium trenchii TaxID=1381693 RepID=A0ABP0N477_9DINO